MACDGSNISPVTLNILNLKLPDGSYYFPGSGTDELGRRTFSIPAEYKGDQIIINTDYIISSKHTISGRFFPLPDSATTSISGYPSNKVFKPVRTTS